MWNIVILPILTSLAATGLGIFLVWLYNRKRNADQIANEIARIINEISIVKGEMENGFNRVALEKDTVLNAFTLAKTEMEQANQDAALKQREFYLDIVEKIHNETVEHENFRKTVIGAMNKMEQDVSKNSDLIERIITIMEGNVQSRVNPNLS